MVSVMQTVDTAHEDMIHDAQLDYYGTRLATCSSDKTIKVFDVRNRGQSLLSTLARHEGPVWQVAWSHPVHGNLLASCSYDRRVLIWRETTGASGGQYQHQQQQQQAQWEVVHEHAQHESSVNSVAWAPHEFGLAFACASSDGSISVVTCGQEGSWDTSKIPNAHTIGVNAVSWAPATQPNSLLCPAPGDDTRAGAAAPAQPPARRLVSGGCDGQVRIWRLQEDGGQWVKDSTLEGHSDWVRDVAWAPNLGLSKDVIASCGQDCRVIIWTKREDDASWSSVSLPPFQDAIWHVSWSVTGNMLAVSSGDNKVSLWKESLDGQWICLNAPSGADEQ